jgi:hypothetical protein
MDLFKSIFSSSTPHKKIMPVVYITTHGSYELVEWSEGEGINRNEGQGIIEEKLPLGMKIHIIGSAPLGVCSFSRSTDVEEVCKNINRYMHDERTEEELINDLVGNLEDVHNNIIDNNRSIDPDYNKLLKELKQARTHGKMVTYQKIDNLNNTDPRKSPSYYDKYFKRTIEIDNLDEKNQLITKEVRELQDIEELSSYYDAIEELDSLEKDLESYNDSNIGRRINLIQPEDSRTKTRYSGPQIRDIYDDVIEYQYKNKDLFPEYRVPENTVLLSGIINYMKSIGINEFIIMDYSCSAVEGISLSEPMSRRTLRLLNRNSPTSFTPLVSKHPLTPVDRPRTRDNSPYRKGGKRTKKHHTHKKTNHRRKLGRKTRKTCKNKKRI